MIYWICKNYLKKIQYIKININNKGSCSDSSNLGDMKCLITGIVTNCLKCDGGSSFC